MKINQNYAAIKNSYLFSEIAARVDAYVKENPNNKVIRLGIGDVTKPICPVAVTSMKKACDEMGTAEGFHGYGPEQGYMFLRQAIADYYKTRAGVELSTKEIFISDGAKSDIGNILDLFDEDNTVLIPDPVYPVYADTNIMSGHKLIYMQATRENGFLPMPDEKVKADIIYLCSPNNPTGAVYSKSQLQEWVDYALSCDAIIIFDAAYEAFVEEDELPTSIFEIEGARECAIEFCSLSKTAGFTGVRCGYTVVPTSLIRHDFSLRDMWQRRQDTKFNGTSYIVQRGAESVFSPEGIKQIRENIEYYKKNAQIITETLERMGLFYTGGKNSPYIWVECPKKMKSWDLFDIMLRKAEIVGTPGEGFGENGEGFMRLTAFNTQENTTEAMRRFEELFS